MTAKSSHSTFDGASSENSTCRVADLIENIQFIFVLDERDRDSTTIPAHKP